MRWFSQILAFESSIPLLCLSVRPVRKLSQDCPERCVLFPASVATCCCGVDLVLRCCLSWEIVKFERKSSCFCVAYGRLQGVLRQLLFQKFSSNDLFLELTLSRVQICPDDSCWTYDNVALPDSLSVAILGPGCLLTGRKKHIRPNWRRAVMGPGKCGWVASPTCCIGTTLRWEGMREELWGTQSKTVRCPQYGRATTCVAPFCVWMWQAFAPEFVPVAVRVLDLSELHRFNATQQHR